MNVIYRFLSLAFFAGVFLALSSEGHINSALAQDNSSMPQFSNTVSDFPLMPGLIEMEEQAVLFDRPEGRIVEIVAYVQAGSPDTISAYYNRILPQLGWTRRATNLFAREQEKLSFDFEALQTGYYVTFRIEPL